MKNNLATNLFITSLLVTALVGYDIAHTPKVHADYPEAGASGTLVTPSPAPTQVSYSPVEEDIRLTFGVYADKAMILLRGNGDGSVCSRGENHELDPLAKNDNTSWGGKGVDRGIFQISSFYHPDVTDAEAYDYKFNIAYAYKMFVRDGYTFREWTCGRFLSI